MEGKIFAGFYLEKLYFIPHFEPVIEELKRRQLEYIVIIPSTLKRDEVDQRQEAIAYCRQNNYCYCFPEETNAEIDFLIFGNTPQPLPIKYKKSILIFHGTWGGKSVYLNPQLNEVDIRFIDGQFYKDILGERFPEAADKLHISGYSKLDSYFKLKPQDKEELLKRCHLDPLKKTILYAPTFYPSSILKIKSNFPEEFKDYNIIIKPHANIFLRRKYRRTLSHIRKWEKYSNVCITDFKDTNILPFMYAADLLLSDISSAVYEFAGLGKPVIVNMFLHLRWHHRIRKNVLEKRLDRSQFHLWEVGKIVNSYAEMTEACHSNLIHPDLHKQQREKWVKYVLGEVDGKVSSRIVDKLCTSLE